MAKIISAGNPFGTVINFPFLSTSLQRIIFPQRIRFGGDGSDGAFTAPSGITNVSGIKQYTSLSVPVGATLNLTDNTYIFCQGNVSIAGAITCTAGTNSVFTADAGESGGASNTPRGGKMGSSFYKYQFFRVAMAGGKGGIGGAAMSGHAAGFGGKGGSGGGGGAGYTYGGDGKCGDQGTTFTETTGAAGGFGGKGLYIECIGNITISGTITLSGANGTVGATADSGGGGGGGGGSFFCFALGDADLTGTFNSNGGNGGNSGATTAGGSGGGAAGYFHLGYQGTLIANTLTANVTGGTGGTGATANGDAGQNGASDIYQLKSYT